MSAESASPEGNQTKALIWDLPTRLCHWFLALCFAGSWLTAEAGFDWTEVHFYFGYTTLGLVVFRVLWGFVGPTHARFTSFVKGPGTVVAYLRGRFPAESTDRAVGHNPLGALAILAMLALLFLQASVGLFVSDDVFYAGPYNAAVSEDLAGNLAYVHHLNFNFLLALIGLHLVAIFWYRWRRQQKLVGPMIHGHKMLPADQAEAVGLKRSRLLIALVLAAVIAGTIYALVEFAPPPRAIDFY